MALRRIAVLGDTSDHGGELITTNQDDRFEVNGIPVCVDKCIHRCGNPLHGDTEVTAIVTKTKVNNKLVITEGATAACGAVITPSDRGVYVE